MHVFIRRRYADKGLRVEVLLRQEVVQPLYRVDRYAVAQREAHQCVLILHFVLVYGGKSHGWVDVDEGGLVFGPLSRLPHPSVGVHFGRDHHWGVVAGHAAEKGACLSVQEDGARRRCCTTVRHSLIWRHNCVDSTTLRRGQQHNLCRNGMGRCTSHGLLVLLRVEGSCYRWGDRDGGLHWQHLDWLHPVSSTLIVVLLSAVGSHADTK
mmetsp:Transcript_35671/g.92975  ORF Transcript_35671/g.92975 Transcript_35671/m.92975 type:complete len:209 (+) Transcript_35671:974-1600(+)